MIKNVSTKKKMKSIQSVTEEKRCVNIRLGNKHYQYNEQL